jgi:hypothetical protein
VKSRHEQKQSKAPSRPAHSKVRCADDAGCSAWTKLLVATQSDKRYAKASGVISFHPQINGRLANAPQKITQETLS